MAVESFARKPAENAGPSYRTAPHNIEAEQALLGALLVNNEALYRVSDFLEPLHFFEPIHQQIYEIARSLIRTGKLASPVTLKTFLPADVNIVGLTAAQYLARLAAEVDPVVLEASRIGACLHMHPDNQAQPLPAQGRRAAPQ